MYKIINIILRSSTNSSFASLEYLFLLKILSPAYSWGAQMPVFIMVAGFSFLEYLNLNIVRKTEFHQDTLER